MQPEKAGAGPGVLSIGASPVMQSALGVAEELGKRASVTLRAEGDSIPNAVAVANIITEKMLSGRSALGGITLDTTEEPGIGKMTSTVQIVINRT